MSNCEKFTNNNDAWYICSIKIARNNNGTFPQQQLPILQIEDDSDGMKYQHGDGTESENVTI